MDKDFEEFLDVVGTEIPEPTIVEVALDNEGLYYCSSCCLVLAEHVISFRILKTKHTGLNVCRSCYQKIMRLPNTRDVCIVANIVYVKDKQ